MYLPVESTATVEPMTAAEEVLGMLVETVHVLPRSFELYRREFTEVHKVPLLFPAISFVTGKSQSRRQSAMILHDA